MRISDWSSDVCSSDLDTAEKALDGISFSIKPGERVALIARVVSGKSTIARLILGLYTAQEGLVMIDGTDIRQYDPGAMRAQIGVAMQDSVLLSGDRKSTRLNSSH